MRQVIAATMLILTIETGEADAMEINAALHLVRAWAQDQKDMTLVATTTVQPNGDFLTKSAGAFFRYDAARKQLLVSGLVRYNVKLHSEFPDTWDKQIRASKREWATLGEGQLELCTQKLFAFDPDVVLLTKTFSDGSIKPARFEAEVSWLLSGAYYWYMKRYNEVLVTPEKTLIAQGAKINEEMLKVRPRPW